MEKGCVMLMTIEYSKVSECFTYNSETFESGDTLTRPVLSEEDIQQRDTTESDD